MTQLKSEVEWWAGQEFNNQSLSAAVPQRSNREASPAQDIRDYALIIQRDPDSCERLALRCTLDEMRKWLPDFGVDPDPQVMIHAWTIGYIDPLSEDIFVAAGNTAGLRNLLAQLLYDSVRYSPRRDILGTLSLVD